MVRTGLLEEVAFKQRPGGGGNTWVFGGNLLTLAWPGLFRPHSPSYSSGFQTEVVLSC